MPCWDLEKAPRNTDLVRYFDRNANNSPRLRSQYICATPSGKVIVPRDRFSANTFKDMSTSSIRISKLNDDSGKPCMVEYRGHPIYNLSISAQINWGKVMVLQSLILLEGTIFFLLWFYGIRTQHLSTVGIEQVIPFISIYKGPN